LAGTVTESQVAATVAALVGEDYNAEVPKAGHPIADVLGSKTLVADDLKSTKAAQGITTGLR
jgi:hypothetical protein